YLEGRKIAGFVHQHGIATRVMADAECFSACAAIFMAGRSLGLEVDGPPRILDVRGQLGFYAPYFNLKNSDSFSGDKVNSLVALNSILISDLIRFGSYVSPFDYQPMFSLSLLGELLLTGPTDMALVDTVEKAARWRIELSGQRAKAKLNEKDLVQTCLNFQAWSLDRPSSETDDDDDQNVFPLERRQFRFWD